MSTDAPDFLEYNIPMMQEEVFTYEDYDDFNDKLFEAGGAWYKWCVNLQKLGMGQFSIPTENYGFFTKVARFVDDAYNALGYHEEEYDKRRWFR